jgi:hypothetical protein
MEDKLKYKIKSTVEKLGILQCRQIFGDDIIKQVYIDNPESYLDQFKNLRKVDNFLWISYMNYHNGECVVFFHNNKNKRIFFNNALIWDFFYEIMDYNQKEIEKILRIWLDKNYNIKYSLPVKMLQ